MVGDPVTERHGTSGHRGAGALQISREVEVLTLVAQGAANKEVARTLYISGTTVKTHLSHIFTKLGVDNRTAAVTVALDRGILRRPR